MIENPDLNWGHFGRVVVCQKPQYPWSISSVLVISFDCHHFRICMWLWLKITESAKSQFDSKHLGPCLQFFFLAACPGLLVEGLHHSRQWWLYTPLQLWQWKLNSPFEGSAGARQHNRTYMGKYMQYQRMSYMYVQCQYELNIHCIQLDSSVVLVLVLKQS